MWDLRQDKRYARYMESIEWDIDTYKSVYIYSKRLPIVPLSLTKVQRAQQIVPNEELRKIARRRKSFYLVIESTDQKQEKYYSGTSFKQTTSISLPSKTIILDLTKSTNNLLKSMHQKTRYNIHKHKRTINLITVSRDIDKFVHYWQKSAKDRGMFIPQKREIKALFTAFSKTSTLYFWGDSTPLAGLMCVGSKQTMYYMHAFSTPDANKLFAPTLLTWKSITDAKRNYSTYDFEGIYDDRTKLSSWKGFSRFKQGFGGQVIVYPLPLQKYILPRW